MHSTKKSCCSQCCKKSIRINGCSSWDKGGLFDSFWGLYFKINRYQVHDWWCVTKIKFEWSITRTLQCNHYGRGSRKKSQYWCSFWYLEKGCTKKKGHQNYHYISNYERTKILELFWWSTNFLNSRSNFSSAKNFWKSCCKWLCWCSCKESCCNSFTTTPRRYFDIHDRPVRYRVYLQANWREVIRAWKCTKTSDLTDLFSTKIIITSKNFWKFGVKKMYCCNKYCRNFFDIGWCPLRYWHRIL